MYMLFWMNKNSCDQMRGKFYCYYFAFVSCNTVMHGHLFVPGLTVSTTGWLSVVLSRRWGQTNTPSSRSVVQSYGEPLCNTFEQNYFTFRRWCQDLPQVFEGGREGKES